MCTRVRDVRQNVQHTARNGYFGPFIRRQIGCTAFVIQIRSILHGLGYKSVQGQHSEHAHEAREGDGGVRNGSKTSANIASENSGTG